MKGNIWTPTAPKHVRKVLERNPDFIFSHMSGGLSAEETKPDFFWSYFDQLNPGGVMLVQYARSNEKFDSLEEHEEGIKRILGSRGDVARYDFVITGQRKCSELFLLIFAQKKE